MSIFNKIPKAPVDPIFGVRNAYLADRFENKVDLGIGAYRTDEGKPWILPCIQEAERIVNDNRPNYEYLNIDGIPELYKGASKIIFGNEFVDRNESRLVSTQALSGTGSLRLAAEFFKKFMKDRLVYVSNPTWGNHFSVFGDADMTVKTYRYFDSKTLGLDYEGFIADLKAAPEGSIIVLHACAHNPTGVDPTKEEWAGIYQAMKDRRHFAFFDSAYQGFATGDLDADAYAIRYFAQHNGGVELMVAQSFAKNFGVYCERTGALHVLCNDPDSAEIVRSQLKVIIRASYSNPPAHGARLIAAVFNNPKLVEMWKQDMRTMSQRISSMRTMLYEELQKLNTPGDWTHILKQIGMFTYTGLTESQVERVTKEFHIYLLKSGRISMCGVTTKNVAYIAKAIHAVTTTQAKI
eukprot:TRINITY_DN237_c0_g1_i1.p1 TRINITY_DN237_c0_g1~~TRINITY_DN237_c0_g1_i1.p1  ORF type:complete len:408 (-),score=77.81 TRINITY_DN237_c0_g1_i1:79-1302(-)